MKKLGVLVLVLIVLGVAVVTAVVRLIWRRPGSKVANDAVTATPRDV